MISSVGTQTSLREWALSRAGTEAAGGKSYLELMQEAVDAIRQEKLEEYDRFMNRVAEKGNGVKLTLAQKEQLRERFDPEDMSQEEYQDFLDELCGMGVIDESDKPYLGYGVPEGMESIPLEFAMRVTVHESDTTRGGLLLGSPFGSVGGSLLEWVKQRASTQALDGRTQTWVTPRDAVLFDRLRKVLEAIS